MPSSTVEVCNDALALVGDSPITALTDDSDRARTLNRLWLPTLDTKLREHDWNFARRRMALAELADTPVWGYAHQFQLPQSPFCLFVRGTDLTEDEPWIIETYSNATSTYRVLLTDATSVNLVFTARSEDVTLWDAGFADGMTFELAYRIAYPLTRNATLAQSLQTEKDKQWQRARSRDGQEGRPLTRLLSSVFTQNR